MLKKQKDNPPRSLSRKEFEKMRDLEIEEHRYSHITTHNMFLFVYMTGTAYVDVVAITNGNLSKDDAGDSYLNYQRGKNGKLCRVKLLPEAIELIEKIVIY